MSDLEQVLSGEQPEAVEPTPEPEAAEAETPEAVDPKPETEAPKSEPTMVPVSVLQELRAELKEAKLAAQRTQQQPVAPAPEFIDPEGMSYMQQQVQQIAFNADAKLQASVARLRHGDAVVDEAYEAAKAANMLDVLGTQPDAWNKLVQWHKQQKVAQEIGDDPAAYKAKMEAEIRAKVQAEMVAEQAKAKAAQAAPSMANVTGTGGGPKANAWAGPTPLNRVLGE